MVVQGTRSCETNGVVKGGGAGSVAEYTVNIHKRP